MRRVAGMFAPFRYLYYLWVKYVRRDHIWAGLVRQWRAQSAFENWKLVSQREMYRARWFEWWNEQGLDVIITPPNATPALPHKGMGDAVSSCEYTFLFNLVSSPKCLVYIPDCGLHFTARLLGRRPPDYPRG